ncbi:metallophosphoesterase family protein [Paenibacillus sp. SAF-054]|uniref:metallophosphoesterase family protein n=1 Tax=unclassified Paenibacillus TaxID=185978 RepID=UPI003F81923B
MKTIRFDLISDIHLDFWVENSSNHLKQDKKLDRFITDILPSELSNTLVIAGDLGHYNIQNHKFLVKLKKLYKYIVLVPGNHDYYLITKSLKNKYKNNSIKRSIEMKLMAEELTGVYFLDGVQIELDNVIYGGCGMWYDFEYGLQVLNMDWNQIYDNWKSTSNDSLLIEGKPRLVKDMFQEEKSKLLKVLTSTDVIVTHVSPDWSAIANNYKGDLSNSYYYFDGKEFFNDINGRIWCSGHIHRRMDYMNYGCRFINAALGYPDENMNLPKKIMTVFR